MVHDNKGVSTMRGKVGNIKVASRIPPVRGPGAGFILPAFPGQQEVHCDTQPDWPWSSSEPLKTLNGPNPETHLSALAPLVLFAGLCQLCWGTGIEMVEARRQGGHSRHHLVDRNQALPLSQAQCSSRDECVDVVFTPVGRTGAGCVQG